MVYKSCSFGKVVKKNAKRSNADAIFATAIAVEGLLAAGSKFDTVQKTFSIQANFNISMHLDIIASDFKAVLNNVTQRFDNSSAIPPATPSFTYNFDILIIL